MRHPLAALVAIILAAGPALAQPESAESTPAEPSPIEEPSPVAAPSFIAEPSRAAPRSARPRPDTRTGPGANTLAGAAPDPTGAPPFPIISFDADTRVGARFDTQPSGSSNSLSVLSTDGSIGATIITGPRLVLNLSTSAEYAAYDFEGTERLIPSIAGTERPFEDVQTYGLGATAFIRASEELSLIVGTGISSSYEAGADFDESLAATIRLGFRYQISETLALGVALGVRNGLDGDYDVIPLPVVEWKINERLTLETAPLGLQLGYRHNDSWRYGAVAAFEGREFRLDDDGPIPGGVAQDFAIIGAGFVEWSYEEWLSLRLELGAQVWSQFELINEDDNTIYSEDLDPALALIASVAITF